jgi:hypothetical protein
MDGLPLLKAEDRGEAAEGCAETEARVSLSGLPRASAGG